MTIRIPLRALLFVLYTVAVLGGAFGISYAVFEWREDTESVESLDRRVVRLSNQVESVSASSPLSPDDSRQCHVALIELLMVTVQAQKGEISGGALEQKVKEVYGRVEIYC